jgi:hypothetical protein
VNERAISLVVLPDGAGPRALRKPFLNAGFDASQPRYPRTRTNARCERTMGFERNLDRAMRLAGEHRNLFCPQYDDCLDVAVKAKWPGWTCRGCSAWGDRTYDSEG